MSRTINKGREYEVRNISLNATTDVPVDFTSRFISSVTIQCRTSVDILLRRTASNNDYFTIKSGTVFNLDCSLSDQSQGGYIVGYLRSGTGTVTAEVIGYIGT